MAVIAFGGGKMYACSRCPGWQTDALADSVRHIANHERADLAAGICPVCIRAFDRKTTDGRKDYVHPCGHRVSRVMPNA